MKTNREISDESLRLEQLAHELWDQHRQRNDASRELASTVKTGTFSRVLFRFPATEITEYRSDAGTVVAETHRMSRSIEVEFDEDKPIYRLIEEDFLAEPFEGLELLSAVPVTKSDSIFHALTLGYEMVEEDRLSESLTPIVERLNEAGFCEGMHIAVEKIESLIEASELSVSERLRSKVEILAFLEGRLDRGAFVTAAIDRWRESVAESESIKSCETERLSIESP